MHHSMEHHAHLLSRAHTYADELSKNEVLKLYWDRLSLILKGSTAKGYTDQYSDIDFVIFTDSQAKDSIISEYVKQNISQRKDGIFLPLGDWEGHYNIDTYETLASHFTSLDMPYIWEYTQVIIMHDAANRFENIINGHKNIRNHMDQLIREKYLEIQLSLDWMRQPLRRADKGASLLYGASIQRCCCQILFLFAAQPYPCDKWLFYCLDKLDVPFDLKTKVIHFHTAFNSLETIKPDLELTAYDLYAKASDLVDNIACMLKGRYGTQQWIDEWYLYA